MKKQISLSMLDDELLQVRTKKKEFLEQIERIVPWGEWKVLIKHSVCVRLRQANFSVSEPNFVHLFTKR